jgi:hypothetical protein
MTSAFIDDLVFGLARCISSGSLLVCVHWTIWSNPEESNLKIETSDDVDFGARMVPKFARSSRSEDKSCGVEER